MTLVDHFTTELNPQSYVVIHSFIYPFGTYALTHAMSTLRPNYTPGLPPLSCLKADIVECRFKFKVLVLLSKQCYLTRLDFETF